MTLAEAIDRHCLVRVDGHEQWSRWVIVRSDAPTPKMFGDLLMAQDFSMCGALSREHAIVFMFQRNAKPTVVEDQT